MDMNVFVVTGRLREEPKEGLVEFVLLLNKRLLLEFQDL
jgi:hypothetical protein